MVSGHHAPAFTVASLATITAGRAFDAADAGDHARRGRLAVVLVIGDQQADFEEHGARIDQLCDALPRRQLSFAVLLFDFLRAAAGAKLIFKLFQSGDQRAHMVRWRLSH